MLAHLVLFIAHIIRHRRRPVVLPGALRWAQPPKIWAIRAEIVVGEYDIGLTVAADFIHHLRDIAHHVRLPQPLCRQVAEPATVVAAARGRDARGRQETPARDQGAPRRRIKPKRRPQQ
jgi:hypothetical protein